MKDDTVCLVIMSSSLGLIVVNLPTTIGKGLNPNVDVALLVPVSELFGLRSEKPDDKNTLEYYQPTLPGIR